MYNELTEVDIRKMQEEIDYKTRVVRPKCIEDLKTARGFGDLSENYEYKAAKQELRRCDSRLRYLKRMIATAKVVKSDTREGVAGLFDRVTIRLIEDDEIETVQLVTSMRQDALQGRITRNSPVGQALWGRRPGETVTVHVSDSYSYDIEILSREKGEDDESLPILPY